MDNARRESGALGPWIALTLLAASCSAGDDQGEDLATVGDAAGTERGDGPPDADDAGSEGSGGSMGEAGSTGGAANDDDAQAYVEEAKAEFPTYIALHDKVITRTCTPDPGNCHNNKEYPELDTPLAMLSAFDKECNLAERTLEPQQIYNGCEPAADFVQFIEGSNVGVAASRVAYIEPIFGPEGPTSFEVHVEDPIPNAMVDPASSVVVRFSRHSADGSVLTIDDVGHVVHGAGSTYFTVTNAAGLSQSNLDTLEKNVLGGDLNRDGVFGAQDEEGRMRELDPGNPWQSYLLQRVQGNVPGSPMPLANPPLSAAEIVAIACWIEGAATPEGQTAEAAIDYDGCQYAADFGTPPEDSGATLSGHVQPIFDAACAFAGCHASGNPAAGLDLTAGRSRESLLDTASTQVTKFDLVELGNPTNSYLVKKIRGSDDIAHAPMPPEGFAALTDTQIATIKLWISYGAPND